MTADLRAILLFGIIFGPFAISALYSTYMSLYGATGKHHFIDEMLSPPGQIWLHSGTWWTFTRLKAGRVERLFDKRANPLDEELIFDTVAVPDKVQRIPREREY